MSDLREHAVKLHAARDRFARAVTDHAEARELLEALAGLAIDVAEVAAVAAVRGIMDRETKRLGG